MFMVIFSLLSFNIYTIAKYVNILFLQIVLISDREIKFIGSEKTTIRLI